MNKTFMKCLAPVMLLGTLALPMAASADPPYDGGQLYDQGPPPSFNGDRGPGRDGDWGLDRGHRRGVAHWSGEVDDTVVVSIHASDIDTNTVHGRRVRDVDSNVDGRLPHFPGHVFLRDSRGRGDIQIIEQPRPDNDFTARVRIYDGQRGASHYRFTLAWTPDGPPPGRRDFRGADRFSRPDDSNQY